MRKTPFQLFVLLSLLLLAACGSGGNTASSSTPTPTPTTQPTTTLLLSPLIAPRQVGQGPLAVVHVARRDLAGEEFPSVVDHQMELEAIVPIHRILAALGQSGKDAMLLDAAIVTDDQRGRVHEADAGALPPAGLQIGAQRHQDRGDQFHKAAITDQPWKLRSQVVKTYSV